ncbi:MAG: intradiol ring-cleavage dioxygenase [Candidatus Rokubacteria bacterium]|nr:intradiol ring-cleavage dioxygenase [Candidatus Rokubacteria bacterium]
MVRDTISRRDFLKISFGTPAALALGEPPEAMAHAQPLRPTPACADDAEPTPRQTAGPFFKPDSPGRTSLLEPGIRGTKIVLTGLVLSTDCKPVARALVDFWHADDRGDYDNAGYKLRGHQLTDDHGRYRLETIVPGLYPGRTRHFHVRVQAPSRPVLTTQLYFPGEPQNQRDFIFNQELVMKLQDAADGKVATFDFALDLTGRGRSRRG